MARAKANVSSEEQQAAALYQQMLDDLGAEGGDSKILFVKDGRNRYRLMKPDPNSQIFFKEVFREFKAPGQPVQRRKRYVVKVYALGEEEGQVRGLVIPKTALQAILNLLVEGHELFDPALGHGVTLVRSGKGLETKYNVVISPKPVPLPGEALDDQTTLQEYYDMVEKINERKRESNNGDTPLGETEDLPFDNPRTGAGDW